MFKKLLLLFFFVATNVLAAENLIELQPLVVTGTRTPHSVFDLPMSIEVIDKETINDSKLNYTAAENLNRVSGISVSDNNWQEPKIVSRGFGNKAASGTKGIRIYRDGLPISTPDGFGTPSAADLNTIGSIEVMKGPFSTMYGSTSAGVVHFITEKPTEPHKVETKIMGGSFNTNEVNVKYSGVSGPLSYLVNQSELSSDTHRVRMHNDKHQTTANLWLDVNEDTKLGMAFHSNHQQAEDPGAGNGALTLPQYQQNPKSADPSVYNINGWKNTHQTDAAIKLNQRINNNNSFMVAMYGGTKNQDNLNPTTASNTLSTTSTGLQKYDRIFYGSEARYDYTNQIIGHPFKASFGISYSKIDDDKTTGKWMTNGVRYDGNTITKSSTERVTNFDQYVQGEIGVTKTIDWHLGVRRTTSELEIVDRLTDSANGGDNSGKIKFAKYTPATGVTWKVTPLTSVYGTVGSGVEMPVNTEFQNAQATATSSPNMTIKPATSTNYEVGFKTYQIPNTYLAVSAFKIDTKDEIVQTANVSGYRVYANQGTTTRQGVDLVGNVKLPYNFNFYGVYSYIDATFDANDNKLPGVPNNNAFAELSWKYNPWNLKIAGEMLHNGKTYATTDNTLTPAADSWTVYNLKAKMTQKYKDFMFSEYLAINNITDKNYISSVKVDGQYSRYYEPGAERNYVLGVSASYSF